MLSTLTKMSLPKAVREWLSEYKVLTQGEVHSYATTVHQNEELITSLYCLFESLPSLETLEPVYHQLFEFYRSPEIGLKRFTLEFVPTLIWLYLSSLSVHGKKSCCGLEAFLLAVYNLEIINVNGKPKVKSFRVPSFNQPSVYHEPGNLGSFGGLSLTESILSRYNQSNVKEWHSGPFPQYEAVNAQNRQGILAYLLQCYNADIANLSTISHQMMCKACSRIAITGFPVLHQLEEDEGLPLASYRFVEGSARNKRHSQVGELPPRITVSPALLVEMLSGIYFIMYNGQSTTGIKASVDIHHRASFELYADVLLVTNAIRNTLQCNAAGHLDGPMGINVSLTPATSGHTISKSAITNASFRARKLPDDISIPASEDTKLHTIDEDADNTNRPTPKTSKSALGKLVKKGEKFLSKELRREGETTARQNGDSSDSLQQVSVGVVKNNSRIIVDSVELQSLRKYSNYDEHGTDDKGSNSSNANKHKSGGLGSNSNRDSRGRHARNPSSSSLTESHSTDL